jgi:hypothetical protein
MSTGPFRLNPNDTAICAFMINFANPAGGGEADGSNTDAADLIANVRNGRDLYYNRHLYSKTDEETFTYPDLEINKLYPNPAGNHINVEINIPNDGYFGIEIMDLIGNKIAVYSFSANTGIHNYTVKTADLQSGTYILKISSYGMTSQNMVSKIFSVLK